MLAFRASVFTLTCLVCSTASAQVTRLEVLSTEPAAGGQAFGAAGPYEILRGRVHGELDPADRHNAIIQDLTLAPRNSRGRVEYVATFALAKPVDMKKASGVLVYSVVNRGNGAASPGPEGDISVVSGWQGDVVPSAANQTIRVPAAKGADGTPLTGPFLARFRNLPPGTTTVAVRGGGYGGGSPEYPGIAADQAKATLVSAAAETASGRKIDRVEIPRSEWTFADCRSTPFPGVPDPGRLCVKGGFDPSRVYELVYVAQDPLVLGIGLAATRDLVSFLRHGAKDDAGAVNPVAGAIGHVIAIGNSQSGNFIKTFIHLGFNEDLQGRIVWDGAFPRIAARQTPINFRFAIPGGAAGLYEPGSEPALWWSPYDDAVRGRGTASLLDRCRMSNTCPKIMEAFGAAEFWGLRMSPGLVGTDARADIPLPDNVRRYYYPGTTHGGGRGGFSIDARGGSQQGCVLPANPNPQAEQTRALTRALVAWVVRGTPPPPSRYPLLSRGELVPATVSAIGFPAIPGVTLPDDFVNAVLDYDFGPGFRANDMSGVIDRQPPRIVQVIPTYVPKVNADGNEMSGVPSVLHQAPLGTYLGWNITAAGMAKGTVCDFAGAFIPFAATKAAREATGDARPSLEERYGTIDGYICAVRRAADQAVGERFLLADDRDRIIGEAERSGVLPAAAAASPEARATAQRLCSGSR